VLQERAELFRLLGDEDRLRLLALCAVDELSISELAELMRESQPQITRKTQPLRDAGLLSTRRDGTRTLLRTTGLDGIAVAGLEEGQRLCQRDGSLARVPQLLLAREEGSRRYFDASAAVAPLVSSSWSMLSMLAPLLPQRRLAVDVGAGDGLLLPLLSPLFGRVMGIDRSAARLSQCAQVVADGGLANVRLISGAADDAHVVEEVFRSGRADVVICSRTLHHAARPQDLIDACARLLTPGGTLLVLEYLPHEDELMRQQGDVWLGFAADKLLSFARGARLQRAAMVPMPGLPGAADGHLPLHLMVAHAPTEVLQ
jgi:DNA-binding transcriptional ArsR family regulator/protein-L-isoaspartate O-methyltransferase